MQMLTIISQKRPLSYKECLEAKKTLEQNAFKTDLVRLPKGYELVIQNIVGVIDLPKGLKGFERKVVPKMTMPKPQFRYNTIKNLLLPEVTM